MSTRDKDRKFNDFISSMISSFIEIEYDEDKKMFFWHAIDPFGKLHYLDWEKDDGVLTPIFFKSREDVIKRSEFVLRNSSHWYEMAKGMTKEGMAFHLKEDFTLC